MKRSLFLIIALLPVALFGMKRRADDHEQISIMSLPDELLTLIFTDLALISPDQAKQTLLARRVCKKFYRLINTDIIPAQRPGISFPETVAATRRLPQQNKDQAIKAWLAQLSAASNNWNSDLVSIGCGLPEEDEIVEYTGPMRFIFEQWAPFNNGYVVLAGYRIHERNIVQSIVTLLSPRETISGALATESSAFKINDAILKKGIFTTLKRIENPRANDLGALYFYAHARMLLDEQPHSFHILEKHYETNRGGSCATTIRVTETLEPAANPRVIFDDLGNPKLDPESL